MATTLKTRIDSLTGRQLDILAAHLTNIFSTDCSVVYNCEGLSGVREDLDGPYGPETIGDAIRLRLLSEELFLDGCSDGASYSERDGAHGRAIEEARVGMAEFRDRMRAGLDDMLSSVQWAGLLLATESDGMPERAAKGERIEESDPASDWAAYQSELIESYRGEI